MKNLDKRLVKWINSIPFVKMANYKVFIENGNTGIKPRDEKKPCEYNERVVNKIADMVTGARWFSEEVKK